MGRPAILPLFVGLLLLSSCGGGGGGGGGGKGTKNLGALTTCDANQAAVGTTVKCNLKDCPDNCTVFFEKNKQQFYLDQCPDSSNSKDTPVDIQMPSSIQGTGTLFCCGGGNCDDSHRTILADQFTIKPPTQQTTSCPPGEVLQGGSCVIAAGGTGGTGSTATCSSDTDCPTGDKCMSGTCTPAPAGPVACTTNADCITGKKCKAGSCVDLECVTDADCTTGDKTTCSPTGHCVAQSCTSDADCSSKTTCTAGTCEPLGTFDATLTVDKKFDTRLGLVKVSWNVTGVNAKDITDLQIWSDGFYRITIDGGTPGDECKGKPDDMFAGGLGHTRYLLVNGNESNAANLGGDMTSGTAPYDAVKTYMDSAVKCKDDGSNCHGYTPPTPCFLCDQPPACVMTTKDAAGHFVKSGFVYTRVLADKLKFHLYVKAGTLEKAVDSDPVDVDPVTFTANVDVQTDAPKIRVTATGKNISVPIMPPMGCEPPTGNTPDKLGNLASFTMNCPLNSKSQVIEFWATGLGIADSKDATYKVELDPPSSGYPQFQNGALDGNEGHCDCSNGAANACGNWNQCSKQGKLSFSGGVLRKATISKKRDDNSGNYDQVAQKDVPWVGSLEIQAFDRNKFNVCGTSGVFNIFPWKGALPTGNNGDVSVFGSTLKLENVKLPRNNSPCTGYKFVVKDLDGSILPAANDIYAPFPTPPPQPGTLTVEYVEGPGFYTVNGDGGDCNDDSDVHVTATLHWHATNLTHIEPACDKGSPTVSQQPNLEPSLDGTMAADFHRGGQDDDWGDQFSCTLIGHYWRSTNSTCDSGCGAGQTCVNGWCAMEDRTPPTTNYTFKFHCDDDGFHNDGHTP